MRYKPLAQVLGSPELQVYVLHYSSLVKAQQPNSRLKNKQKKYLKSRLQIDSKTLGQSEI